MCDIFGDVQPPFIAQKWLKLREFRKKWWLDVQKSQLLVQYKALIFLIMLPYIKLCSYIVFLATFGLHFYPKNCQKDVVRMPIQGPEDMVEVESRGIH